MINRFWFFPLCMLAVAGCQPRTTQYVGGPLSPAQFEAMPQPGQLSEEAVQSASDRYDGSMQAQIPDVVDPVTGEVVPLRVQPSGETVVLGPIITETAGNRGPVTQDAGQLVRERITNVVASDDKLVLVDAPEERYVDDSPRPDLEKRGIKFVIKGAVSYSDDTSETTVFLRTVRTGDGKIAAVASGRADNLDEAARLSVTRLIEKLKGTL